MRDCLSCKHLHDAIMYQYCEYAYPGMRLWLRLDGKLIIINDCFGFELEG